MVNFNPSINLNFTANREISDKTEKTGFVKRNCRRLAIGAAALAFSLPAGCSSMNSIDGSSLSTESSISIVDASKAKKEIYSDTYKKCVDSAINGNNEYRVAMSMDKDEITKDLTHSNSLIKDQCSNIANAYAKNFSLEQQRNSGNASF